jgi:hypothetical protein
MLVGIGLIGTLTATVASFFVHERTNETGERRDRIEALLMQLVIGNSVMTGDTDNGPSMSRASNGTEVSASD